MSRYASPTDANVSEGLGKLVEYTNEVTNNIFANMFLLGIYIIIFMGFYKASQDGKGAFAVAGYGTFVVGLLFWIGGWISTPIFALAVGGTIVGTIVLLLDK
jgi:hypothetical protein